MTQEMGKRSTCRLSVLEWARERLDNSRRISNLCPLEDRAGWLEDVWYWARIVQVLARDANVN